MFKVTILFHDNPSMPKVLQSIIAYIGKCFKKNNQELKENLEKTFGISYIPKIKKIREYQLNRVTMNIDISEASNQASDAEKGKIDIRTIIPFAPESTVEIETTDKNKDEFISVTCRYRPNAGDSNKNKYVIQTNLFETETTDNVLLT